MDLRTLRYFVEIARQKSFTLAAQKLFVTQPTLSRQIAELEDELGQVLFDRSTRHIKLTEKGLYFYRQAQSILDLVEKTKLETMSTDDLQGELNVAAGETHAMTLVAEVLEAFQREHPRVRINLVSANGVDAAADVRVGICDFAVIIRPADLDDLDYLVLPRENTWGVLTRKDSVIGQKSGISARELKNIPLYVPQQHRLTSAMKDWLGYSFESLNIVGSYNLLYNTSLLVRAGAHALCLDNIIAVDDDIAFVPLTPRFTNDVVIAWATNRPKRTLTEAFLQMMRAALSHRETGRDRL